MAYREVSQTPVLCGVTQAGEIHVVNGSTAEFAFPCMYAVASESSSCGVTEYEYEEIQLADEGYSDPDIRFDDDVPDGLSAEAWIDTNDGNEHIIRLVVTAECPDHEDEPATCDMVMAITRAATSGPATRTDIVFRGRCVVIAAPLEEVV